MRSRLVCLCFLFAALSPGAITLEEVETGGMGAFRHASYTSEVVTHPDGIHVLSSSRDQCVRLWNLESGKLVRRFTTPDSGDMWGIRFLKGGKEFLAASSSDQVYRYETATGRILQNYPHGSNVYRLAVHPDGKHFVSAGAENTAILWDIEGGRKVRTFAGHSDDLFTVIIVNQGKELITGSDDHSVKKWDLETGECLETLEREPSFKRIFTLARSPDGKRFAMVSDDKYVRVFRCDTLAEVWKSKMTRSGEVLAWSPDGQWLASTCKDGHLYLFSAVDGEVARKIEVPNNPHTPITFSRDGKLLISGGDFILHLHEVSSGERVEPGPGFSETSGNHNYLAVGPGGKRIYLAAGSTLIARDRSEAGTPPRLLDLPDTISALALSPDGSLLAVGDSGGRVSVFESDDFTARCKFQEDGYIMDLAFHPDGKRLAISGKAGMVQLWSLPQEKRLRRFRGHRKDVEVLQFSTDGEQLITVSADDRTVRFWSVAHGVEVSMVKLKNERPDSFVSLDGGRSFVVAANEEEVYGRILAKLKIRETVDAQEVGRLIGQLGAAQYQKREEAMVALAEFGKEVLPLLDEVRTDDPEVRSRLLGVREVMRGQMTEKAPEVIATFDDVLGGLAADPLGEFWVARSGSEGASGPVVGLIDQPGKTIKITQTIDSEHGCRRLVFSRDGSHVGTINADGSYSLFKVNRD